MGGCISGWFSTCPGFCNAIPVKKQSSDLGSEQKNTLTRLKKAVESGDRDRVTYLLKRKPQLNCSDGGRILWDAVLKDDGKIASMLVASGADLTVKGPTAAGCSSFLHELVKSKHARHHRLAVEMIERGADVNARDGHGVTVLQQAIEAGCPVSLIKELLRKGVQLTGTSIMRASQYFAPKELVNLLVCVFLHEGSRTERVEELLLRCGGVDYAESNVLPLVEILLKFNLPAAQIDRKGRTLIRAIRMEKFEMVKLLIKYGFDVNARVPPIQGSYEMSTFNYMINTQLAFELPLSAASQLLRTDIAEYLIRAGAKVNFPTSLSIYDGGYAIHGACEKGLVENIRLLLRYGADVNLVDSRRRTAFSIISFIEDLTETHQLFIKHFALLTLKGTTVNKRDLQLVMSSSKMHEYYNQCLNELEKMEKANIIRGISFFSIFSMSEDELSFMIRSTIFMNNYINRLTKLEFLNYYDDMVFLLENAEKRRCQLSDIEELLYEVLLPCLPNLALERVIYFFYMHCSKNKVT
ncbi:ankyrin repeat and KH domain-containing protein mask-like [Phymastichus coffea]|uniref:ankyrin repeat and KH domain-containing protein mask-like n=1 Tax=Phymastichus coffea TaxID=108790 RepID=UPI00273CA1AB|nr:ankyrin repeat and KH domain-containing protein mask-like [Phymastichus coffea]